jgi:hypothetical protein
MDDYFGRTARRMMGLLANSLQPVINPRFSSDTDDRMFDDSDVGWREEDLDALIEPRTEAATDDRAPSGDADQPALAEEEDGDSAEPLNRVRPVPEEPVVAAMSLADAAMAQQPRQEAAAASALSAAAKAPEIEAPSDNDGPLFPAQRSGAFEVIRASEIGEMGNSEDSTRSSLQRPDAYAVDSPLLGEDAAEIRKSLFSGRSVGRGPEKAVQQPGTNREGGTGSRMLAHEDGAVGVPEDAVVSEERFSLESTHKMVAAPSVPGRVVPGQIVSARRLADLPGASHISIEAAQKKRPDLPPPGRLQHKDDNPESNKNNKDKGTRKPVSAHIAKKLSRRTAGEPGPPRTGSRTSALTPGSRVPSDDLVSGGNYRELGARSENADTLFSAETSEAFDANRAVESEYVAKGSSEDSIHHSQEWPETNASEYPLPAGKIAEIGASTQFFGAIGRRDDSINAAPVSLPQTRNRAGQIVRNRDRRNRSIADPFTLDTELESGGGSREIARAATQTPRVTDENVKSGPELSRQKPTGFSAPTAERSRYEPIEASESLRIRQPGTSRFAHAEAGQFDASNPNDPANTARELTRAQPSSTSREIHKGVRKDDASPSGIPNSQTPRDAADAATSPAPKNKLRGSVRTDGSRHKDAEGKIGEQPESKLFKNEPTESEVVNAKTAEPAPPRQTRRQASLLSRKQTPGRSVDDPVEIDSFTGRLIGEEVGPVGLTGEASNRSRAKDEFGELVETHASPGDAAKASPNGRFDLPRRPSISLAQAHAEGSAKTSLIARELAVAQPWPSEQIPDTTQVPPPKSRKRSPRSKSNPGTHENAAVSPLHLGAGPAEMLRQPEAIASTRTQFAKDGSDSPFSSRPMNDSRGSDSRGKDSRLPQSRALDNSTRHLSVASNKLTANGSGERESHPPQPSLKSIDRASATRVEKTNVGARSRLRAAFPADQPDGRTSENPESPVPRAILSTEYPQDSVSAFPLLQVNFVEPSGAGTADDGERFAPDGATQSQNKSTEDEIENNKEVSEWPMAVGLRGRSARSCDRRTPFAEGSSPTPGSKEARTSFFGAPKSTGPESVASRRRSDERREPGLRASSALEQEKRMLGTAHGVAAQFGAISPKDLSKKFAEPRRCEEVGIDPDVRFADSSEDNIGALPSTWPKEFRSESAPAESASGTGVPLPAVAGPQRSATGRSELSSAPVASLESTLPRPSATNSASPGLGRKAFETSKKSPLGVRDMEATESRAALATGPLATARRTNEPIPDQLTGERRVSHEGAAQSPIRARQGTGLSRSVDHRVPGESLGPQAEAEVQASGMSTTGQRSRHSENHDTAEEIPRRAAGSLPYANTLEGASSSAEDEWDFVHTALARMMASPAARGAISATGADEGVAPDLHINIGRIEVKSAAPLGPRPAPITRRLALSLDEYLKRRQGQAG